MMKLKGLLVVVLLVVSLTGLVTDPATAVNHKAADPWMAKPVLPLLLLTAGVEYEQAVADVAAVVPLAPEELADLRAIAVHEAQALSFLHSQSNAVVQNEALTLEARRRGIEEMNYNSRLADIMRDTNGAVRDLLGRKYARFRGAIRDWWAGERARVAARDAGPRPLADITSRSVFATQYYGYTNYEIALPDKKIKFANLGWPDGYPYPPYTATLYRSGYWVWNVLIREVGPWNIDDNYWDSARRLFGDLPLGKPEAEAAYYDGYNGGKDQYGRTVTVPCAVDLTPAVAADLGLAYLQNAWITVYYTDLP